MRTLKGKFIRIIFIAMTILLLVSAQGFATTLVNIQPSVANQSVGSFFNVFVDISNVSDLYAFQFDINFDPTVLQAVDAIEGSFLPTGGGTFFIPGIIDNTAGSISYNADALLSSDPGVTGTGHLAVLSFEAFGQGTSPVSLSNVLLLDSSLSDISFTPNGGTVNISTSTVPEPATMLLLGFGLMGLARVQRKARS
jgi:hypothetical protein